MTEQEALRYLRKYRPIKCNPPDTTIFKQIFLDPQGGVAIESEHFDPTAFADSNVGFVQDGFLIVEVTERTETKTTLTVTYRLPSGG